MLRTEGNGHRHTPSVQHSCGAPEGARSRKPRPVLCLGNRALNGRPTGDAEVGVARCPVTERLVGSDAVVDVAEAGGLHRKRSAVIDGCAVEVLVFEGAEETLPPNAAHAPALRDFNHCHVALSLLRPASSLFQLETCGVAP